jgi:hypothetical protein
LFERAASARESILKRLIAGLRTQRREEFMSRWNSDKFTRSPQLLLLLMQLEYGKTDSILSNFRTRSAMDALGTFIKFRLELDGTVVPHFRKSVPPRFDVYVYLIRSARNGQELGMTEQQNDDVKTLIEAWNTGHKLIMRNKTGIQPSTAATDYEISENEKLKKELTNRLVKVLTQDQIRYLETVAEARVANCVGPIAELIDDRSKTNSPISNVEKNKILDAAEKARDSLANDMRKMNREFLDALSNNFDGDSRKKFHKLFGDEPKEFIPNIDQIIMVLDPENPQPVWDISKE